MKYQILKNIILQKINLPTTDHKTQKKENEMIQMIHHHKEKNEKYNSQKILLKMKFYKFYIKKTAMQLKKELQ